MKFLVFIALLALLVCVYSNQHVHVCKPEERGPHPCPLYYLNSCAWYFSEVCKDFPIYQFCGEKAGNSCMACANPKVEKVTVGECPQA